MDLFPTFCSFAQATLPEQIDGSNLLPVIDGRETGVRDVLYTAFADVQRAIRDPRWKLIRYPKAKVTQLFDLQADQYEMKNLAGKPEYVGKVEEMMARLKQEMAAFGDTTPL